MRPIVRQRPTLNRQFDIASSGRPRPLSTSRSPTGRGPRPTPRGRTRPVSESLEAETNEDVSTSDAPTAAGESSASCAACEAIQSRIQTYLEEVRTLQDTPVEGYDANFERMRVTTQLMRQTNEVSCARERACVRARACVHVRVCMCARVRMFVRTSGE